MLCRVFNIKENTYYYHLNKLEPLEKQQIIQKMLQISKESGNTYGKRRMKKELKAQGVEIGMCRTASWMKEAGIVAIFPKKAAFLPQ